MDVNTVFTALSLCADFICGPCSADDRQSGWMSFCMIRLKLQERVCLVESNYCSLHFCSLWKKTKQTATGLRFLQVRYESSCESLRSPSEPDLETQERHHGWTSETKHLSWTQSCFFDLSLHSIWAAVNVTNNLYERLCYCEVTWHRTVPIHTQATLSIIWQKAQSQHCQYNHTMAVYGAALSQCAEVQTGGSV